MPSVIRCPLQHMLLRMLFFHPSSTLPRNATSMSQCMLSWIVLNLTRLHITLLSWLQLAA